MRLCRPKSAEGKHRMKILAQARRKVARHLDVVELLKSGQRQRLLANVMLNSQQNLILKFQRQRLIESQDDTEESDDVDVIYDNLD